MSLAEEGILHPDIEVQLTGNDGNAFAILGACRQAARRAGLEQSEIDKFMDEAREGDYDHLLRTCMKWFDVQ